MKRLPILFSVLSVLFFGCSKTFTPNPAVKATINGVDWVADSISVTSFGNDAIVINAKSTTGITLYLKASSQMGVNDQTVFDATIISFGGSYNQNSNYLTWNVANEQLKRYEIERSYNGQTFVKAGEVTASGSSTYAWSEMAVPDLPLNTFFYYRLKKIDLNDAFTYSPTIVIKINTPLLLYTNNYNYGINGVLTITAHDKGARVISGTFYSDYFDNNTSVYKHITNGTFSNVRY